MRFFYLPRDGCAVAQVRRRRFYFAEIYFHNSFTVPSRNVDEAGIKSATSPEIGCPMSLRILRYLTV